jgi:hypothetical protein
MEEKEVIVVETEDEVREYILSPHPTARTVLNEETVIPEAPEVAEESMPFMIQQAVDGLREELKAELQSELKGVEFNAKN